VNDDLPDSELLEPYMTSGGETDMTDDQPDLLTELDAASHCPHGVDLDMNDDCDLCISDRWKAVVDERDTALATLAEAEETERELAHQHNVLLDHKRLLLWLHAEAVWQRDEADAEAIARQATLKGLTVEEGAAVLELGPPRELVIAWVDAARKMLDDAPNYTETTVDFPAVSMEIKAAGEVERYVFVVQRAGKVTPHQARLQAEVERDTALAERDAERESRFRWAEEAARLEAELAGCPEWHCPSCGAVTRARNIEFDAQYVEHIALDLVRSWRPATVEAPPPRTYLVGKKHDCILDSCAVVIDPCGGCCRCLGACVYDGPPDAEAAAGTGMEASE
jgi:hypothetical protein